MSNPYLITLEEDDLGQLLDGLEARATAWKKTAEYCRTGKSPADFIVEECAGVDEADRIAADHSAIIAKIPECRETQS